MSAWIGPEEADVLLVSLRVSAAATAISAPVGTALGVLLARGRFRGKLIVDVLVHLPLVLLFAIPMLFGSGFFGLAWEAHLGGFVFGWLSALMLDLGDES